MRQFAQKGFRIEQLSLEAKLLYSGFLLFSLAALLISVVYYMDLVGDRAFEGAREYYGAEEQASESARASSAAAEAEEAEGGPILELPDEMMEEEEHDARPMLLSMTRRKLLEVTHFHLFTVPIFLLVIAHLFMLCRMGPALKLGAMVSGVVSAGVHMLAPWLVYWGGADWAWLMPVTGTWMTLSMLVLILWPAWAMWRRPAPSRARAA